MNGLLIVDKPADWTSHDVVAKVRGLLKGASVGHLGTLDPLATGVLPLLVGAATRLAEYASFDKEYEALCLLGRSTDSEDVTGTVLRETPWEGLDPGTVRAKALELKGLAEQVPPMVSAVKQGGHKLYELARKGLEVERKPRPIRILGLEVLEVGLPRVRFRVACSAGTYVRSLCRELGERLGVGGCLESLVRTRVGPFRSREALPLEEVVRRAGVEPEALLRPATLLLEGMPRLDLPPEALIRLSQGQKLRGPEGGEGIRQVRDATGRLRAIVEISQDGQVRPKKVFGPEGIP